MEVVVLIDVAGGPTEVIGVGVNHGKFITPCEDAVTTRRDDK